MADDLRERYLAALKTAERARPARRPRLADLRSSLHGEVTAAIAEVAS